jgi:cell division protein FtsZ
MSETFRSLFSAPRPGGFKAPPAAGEDPAASSREVRPDSLAGAKILVFGLGGGGSNAIMRMMTNKVQGVEFVVANTDAQALFHNPAARKITMGRGLTKGLGAGANPDIGRRAAEESTEELKTSLEGADMVFLTAGLGGGSGGGAISVVAELARSMGILTVGVVTKPFSFEGLKRKRQAEEALEALKGKVDTLITIPNDRVLSLIEKTTPLTEAFGVIDEVLQHAIEGISDLITQHGLVNVDFADVKSVMQDAGTALMGIGYGTGDNRAAEAARTAIESPLLELSISGAQGILFNITGGHDLSMFEVDEAARIITETAAPEANIIFGAVIDEKFTGTVRCTVVATGFDSQALPSSSAASLQRNLKAPANSRSPMEALRDERSALSGAPETMRANGPKLNEEELEVPAFMRKTISK